MVVNSCIRFALAGLMLSFGGCASQTVAQAAAPDCLAEELFSSASADSVSGNWDRAIETLELSVSPPQLECASVEHQIRAEILLGDLIWKRGDFEKGEAILLSARRRAEETRSSGLLAEAQASIAEIAFARAHLKRSIEPGASRAAYQLALENARDAGREDLVAGALGRLGVIDERAGDLQAAEDLYRQAMAIAENAGAVDKLHLPYAHLGGLSEDRGETEMARHYFALALDVAAQSSKREHMVFALINQARFAQRAELISVDEALSQINRAHEIAMDTGNKIALCLTHLNLASMHARNGDTETAMKNAQAAMDMAQAYDFVAYEDFANLVMRRIESADSR